MVMCTTDKKKGKTMEKQDLIHLYDIKDTIGDCCTFLRRTVIPQLDNESPVTKAIDREVRLIDFYVSKMQTILMHMEDKICEN